MKKIISAILVIALTVSLISATTEFSKAEQADYNISDRMFSKKQRGRKHGI